MNDLEIEFNRKRDLISKRRGYLNRIESDISNIKSELSMVQEKADLYAKCVSVFQHISKLQMNKLKEAFEGFITNGLNQVFPGIEQKAILEFSERGNLREVEFLIEEKCEGKKIVINPYYSGSGGVASAYAFLLRLALLLQQKGDVLKTLILDESFGNVSSNYRDSLIDFLKSLGLQIILVSHINDYTKAGESIIKIRLENGISVIEQ